MNGVAIPGYGTKLISFQPCIRFKDAHLVGETTRHLTNFIMVGQHVFEVALFEPDWIRQRFIELYQFFLQYLTNQQGLYIVNESVWTDNRNKGHSLQIYVAGLEIANQVYTTEHMDGTPLTYRYVDMGMGQARFIQVANKLSNVYAVLGYTQSCRLKDYLRTVALAHGDGIYCSKKNVGYNLRRLVQRLFQEYGYQAVARAVAQQYPALSHALQREHHLWRT